VEIRNIHQIKTKTFKTKLKKHLAT
jgi:hypothetical protein